MVERRRTQDCPGALETQPLLSMLLALRRVNRELVEARDRRSVAEAVCRALTRGEAFDAAFVVLEADTPDGPLVQIGGPSPDHDWTCSFDCIERHYRRGGEAVRRDTEPSECGQCPVTLRDVGRSGLCAPLEHRGRRHGGIVVSVPEAFIADDEVKSVFTELVANLAVTLDRLDAEARLHRLEEARARSDARFTQVFASAPAMMTISSVEDGVFYDVNDAFVSLTGFRREDILGKTGLEVGFVPAPSRAVIRERMQKDGRIRAVELEARRADGSQMWVLFSGEIIDVDGVPRLLASGVDVTERRRAERALRNNDARLRAMFGAAPVGMGLMVGGEFLELNEHLCQLVGFSRDALLGESARILCFDEEGFQRFRELEQAAIRNAGFSRLEADLRHDSGRKIRAVLTVSLLDIEDPTSGIVVAAFDVTDLRRRERAEQFRSQLAELFADGVGVDVLALAALEATMRLTGAQSAGFSEVEPSARVTALATFGPELPRVALDGPGPRQATPREGYAEILVPVVRDGRVSATLALGRTAGPFEDAEVELLQELAGLTWDRVASRRAAQTLQESESRFRMLFENMTAGVALFAPVDDGQDFELRDLNPAGEAQAGLTRAAVLGCRLGAFFLGAEEMGLSDAFRRVLRNGGAVEHPMKYHEGGQLTRWLDLTAYWLPSGHVVSMFVDATQARRMAADRERLAHAIAQAPDGFMITDAVGAAQYVNPAFERITGFALADLVRSPAPVLTDIQDAVSSADALWAKFDRGEAWSGRLERTHKSGIRYTEDTVISPVRDETGRLQNLVMICRDVSEQVGLAQQLLQAQKMEAIGQLTGGVAHDFNNFLQIINGAGELAQLDLEEEHPARASFEMVREAAARASRLVKQLLIFSRRQQMRFRALDLAEVVAGILEMLRRLIGEQIELELEPQEGLRMIRADSGMVEQTLFNLCVNARDAMPNGGRIRIQLAERAFSAQELTAEPWAAPGWFVALIVEDGGAGMTEETRAHLFEPFFTTKGPGHGTGLGLASVYGIMKEHQGLVRVRSRLDEGTRFELYWPVTEDEAPSHADPERSPEAQHALTILVAEDEPNVRAVAELMLGRVGHRVLLAEDGQQAVDLMAARAAEVDLVILDAVMPRMGGFEAYNRIRAAHPAVPVIFATGYSDEVLGRRLPDGEDLVVLQKPFTRKALHEAIERVFEMPDD